MAAASARSKARRGAPLYLSDVTFNLTPPVVPAVPDRTMRKVQSSQVAERRHALTVRLALVIAVATVALYAVPVSVEQLWLPKSLLLLLAFALPLQPLWLASRVSDGGERVAWMVLFASTLVGIGGQVAWIYYRANLPSIDEPMRAVLPEVGFAGWIVLSAIALTLEVDSGRGRRRAALVIDLLLIGTIGYFLAREILGYLTTMSAFRHPFDLGVASANVVVSVALAVASLGVLMSPQAFGGRIPRLLLCFAGFGTAVARMFFAYRLFFGEETPWLAPIWIFGLVIVAAAGAERFGPRAGTTLVSTTLEWSPLRTMVVPIIVAYALSLFIREILGAGSAQSSGGMSWAVLALLIVARVAVAILGSERQAQEVAAWEHRYSMVVSALGEVVYEWDLKTNRVLRSGNIAKVFGSQPDEVADSVYQSYSMMHPDDREETERKFRRAAQRGGWFEIEYRIRHADGSWRLIRDRGLCERDEEGQPARVLGLMSDITEERDAEERLRRAERLASLGGLAAGAAHEINNPLAAIQLAAQMLREDERLPDDVVEDVGVIERQAARAGEVTDRMLVFARRKEGERGALGINEVVGEVLKGVRYDLETHGINVNTEFGDDVPKVWIDAGQIERALLNLVVNAHRALEEYPRGSEI